MWEPLQATLDPGRGLPLLVGPLWWKGYRPRVRPKREPKGTKRFRQRDTEVPLRMRKPRLNGKRLVVLTQKSRRILLGMIHQLILPMKSCLLCSRMLHDSRILVKEGPPWLSQTSPLLGQGTR